MLLATSTIVPKISELRSEAGEHFFAEIYLPHFVQLFAPLRSNPANVLNRLVYPSLDALTLTSSLLASDFGSVENLRLRKFILALLAEEISSDAILVDLRRQIKIREVLCITDESLAKGVSSPLIPENYPTASLVQIQPQPTKKGILLF